MSSSIRAAILHGAGYTGGELLRLLTGHPRVELTAVTSRTFAGRPVSTAHPFANGVSQLSFSSPDAVAFDQLDALFVAAEHGQGAVTVAAALSAGFSGAIIDLSADFRLPTAEDYEGRYERKHPAPELAGTFQYGMADISSPYPPGTNRIANPGCFATGLATAAYPLMQGLGARRVAVSALTGASGSGVKPSAGTHFSTRDGNVRAYKVLAHQHIPEVLQLLPDGSKLDFVPISGPWTRGIWGTLHVADHTSEAEISRWYQDAFATRPLVRLWPGRLPELRWSIGSSFIDIGWMQRDGAVVVGFALDNLLKGASGQAVQNLNLVFGWPETLGLIPGAS